MTAMHDLRGFQRDLLFVVRGLVEPNGQEIRRELEQTLGAEVQQSRLYSNLNDLIDAGLLEKSQLNGRTNRYTLTREGERVIESRHEWERQHLEPAEPS